MAYAINVSAHVAPDRLAEFLAAAGPLSLSIAVSAADTPSLPETPPTVLEDPVGPPDYLQVASPAYSGLPSAADLLKAVRPGPAAHRRIWTLQNVTSPYLWSSFDEAKGEAAIEMRAGLAALSKAIKGVHPAGLTLIAVKKREFFDDGSYKGTTYIRTALGAELRALLIAEGIVSAIPGVDSSKS